MYQMDSRVRYSEVDQKGHLTIVALINYLQDCAAFHSESLGYGLPFLSKRSKGWFLTSWKLKIASLPAYGETIHIKTWPHEMRGMIAKRNFLLENEAGEKLVAADSVWVLMNLRTGRPDRIPPEAIEAYHVEPPLDGDWGGRRISLADESDFVSAGTAEVMPVHLDTNRHMNNAYYIEIARDALPKDKKIFGIRAEYKKPAGLGDVLHIRLAAQADGTQVLLQTKDNDIYTIMDFKTD